MTEIVVIDPGDQTLLSITWDDLPAGVTLAGSVEHTVPSPLTRMAQATDTVAGTSQVKVSGAVHGGLYMIEGQATLSNGESINRQFPVRCFNG